MSSTRDIQLVLESVLSTKYLDDYSIIRLSMASKGMEEFVFHSLTENMLNSGILNSETLASVFLFPHLYPGNQYNEDILKLVLSYIGFLTPKASYDLDVIEQLINIIKKSGYENNSHYYSVCSNLGFFGNRDVLELMIDGNFLIPQMLDQKVKFSAISDIEAERIESANKYLKTYFMMIEKKLEALLKNMLEKIKTHKPILNGGGDVSIPEIGHSIPKQAAKVYKIIKNALEYSDSIIDEYKSVHELVLKKLSPQKKKGILTSFGERDVSTTRLYSHIIGDLIRGSMLINDVNKLQSDIDKLINLKKNKNLPS